MHQLMAANTKMGKNNIFLSTNSPTMGQVGFGAVLIAAALFSHFYQGGLGFIKHTRVGMEDGLGTVRVFPVALFDDEMKEMSWRVTTQQ